MPHTYEIAQLIINKIKIHSIVELKIRNGWEI
jgi:hypothetical protein